MLEVEIGSPIGLGRYYSYRRIKKDSLKELVDFYNKYLKVGDLYYFWEDGEEKSSFEFLNYVENYNKEDDMNLEREIKQTEELLRSLKEKQRLKRDFIPCTKKELLRAAVSKDCEINGWVISSVSVINNTDYYGNVGVCDMYVNLVRFHTEGEHGGLLEECSGTYIEGGILINGRTLSCYRV